MYETGTALSAVDLLNKFATFIEANGWTRDSLGNEGTGRRYHAHKGSDYINFRAFLNEAPGATFDSANSSGCYSIAFNVGTAYDGGNPWYGQDGTPVGTSSKHGVAGMWIGNNAVTAYHFFADADDNIYVVVERTSGIYTYLGFGQLIKHGAFTGGVFFFGGQSGVSSATTAGLGFLGGSSPFDVNGRSKGYVTVDPDGESGWHWGTSFDFTAKDTTKRYVRDHEYDNMGCILSQPNTSNGLSLIQPVIVMVERDTSHAISSQTSSIGEFPSIGSFLISPTIVPGQQVTYGSDDYRVFPFYKKDNSDYKLNDSVDSGYRGWAIKE